MPRSRDNDVNLLELTNGCCLLASVICSILLLTTWSLANRTLSYNISVALGLISIVLLLSIMMSYNAGEITQMSLVAFLAVYGTVLYCCYKLTTRLGEIKDVSDKEVEIVMKNDTDLIRLHQISGWATIVFIIITYIKGAYRTKEYRT